MAEQQLSDLAWALLNMFDSHARGGPVPPTDFVFADALRELEALGLVAEGRITEQGEAILKRRYGS